MIDVPNDENLASSFPLPAFDDLTILADPIVPLFSRSTLAGAIVASLLGGFALGLVGGFILRPRWERRRLAVSQRRQSDEKDQSIQSLVGQIPPSDNPVRDSLPVFQIRPEAMVRPPPRILQRQGGSDKDENAATGLRSYPSATSTGTLVDNSPRGTLAGDLSPRQKRRNTSRSSIEYITTLPSPTTPLPLILHHGRKTSSSSLNKRLPAAPYNLGGKEELEPHPWSPTRRVAGGMGNSSGNERLQTADSTDSSRFIPRPVHLHPIDDSTGDEMSLRRDSTTLSRDDPLLRTGTSAIGLGSSLSGKDRPPGFVSNQQAGSVQGKSEIALSDSQQQGRSTPTPTPTPASIKDANGSESPCLQRTKSPTSPEPGPLPPPSWNYDGEAYWNRRGAWQADFDSPTDPNLTFTFKQFPPPPPVSPLVPLSNSNSSLESTSTPIHSSPSGVGPTTITTKEGGAHSSSRRGATRARRPSSPCSPPPSEPVPPAPPLLLFLPPTTTQSSSSYNAAHNTDRRSIFLLEPPLEHNGRRRDQLQPQEGLSPNSRQEEEEEEDQRRDSIPRKTSIDAMLDEMLLAAPVGEPEWRQVVAVTTSPSHSICLDGDGTSTTTRRAVWGGSSDRDTVGSFVGFQAGGRKEEEEEEEEREDLLEQRARKDVPVPVPVPAAKRDPKLSLAPPSPSAALALPVEEQQGRQQVWETRRRDSHRPSTSPSIGTQGSGVHQVLLPPAFTFASSHILS